MNIDYKYMKDISKGFGVWGLGFGVWGLGVEADWGVKR